MKRQKRKMFYKDIIQDNKLESKQFKRATGSPILYTKLKKHRAIYYPLAKYHSTQKPRPTHSHRHACVIYSRTYGREVYSNIDIWPDETARDRLIEKLKGLSLSQEDDVGIDFPTGNESEEEEEEYFESAEDALLTKPSDEKRHVTIIVTDTAKDGSTSSSEKLAHPVHDRTECPAEGEGVWPLKRSHSIDSRDNPFLPGGSLSQEADDILSKATIIRDTFILKDDSIKAKNHNVTKETSSAAKDIRSSSGKPDDHSYDNDSECKLPVNDNMNQQDVHRTETAMVQNATPPRTRQKENGQVDTENSLTPGSVTLDISDNNKDKKKQKKCCVIM